MLDTINKSVQTLVTVSPHLLKPSDAPEKVHVRACIVIQTEAQLDYNETFEKVEEALKYTPYSYILRDAIKVEDLPKKFVLKFDDKITEEDIENFDEYSTFDPADLAQILSGSVCGKSNLKQVSEMADEQQKLVEVGCQTDLMVRPMFLELDDVAQVMCNLQVQTSRTFTPNATMDQVDKDLHLFYHHKGSSEAPTAKKTSPVETHEGKSESRTRLEEYIRTHPITNLTSEDIRKICANCCSEDEVLEKIKSWYDEVGDILEGEDFLGEENIDPITGVNLDTIEAEIIANADMTAETLQTQADRMDKRYSYPTQDIEIQCKEFADHKEPGVCRGGLNDDRKRNKGCTCDCQLYSNDKETKGYDFGICAKKMAQLCKLVLGVSLGEAISSPELIGQTSSDLPLKARACTNRKCNCLYSKGCRHCEKALTMEKKLAIDDPARLKSCKKFTASQNIEFLTDVDGEYADSYLEQLEQDCAFTQTDLGDDYFGTPDAPYVPPPPCTCLTNVEMPWDMITIPPTPKKRPIPPEEEEIMKALPEEVKAQLKELTVGAITQEQLLALTKEFLDDKMGNSNDIEEIQKQILVEKAKIDEEIAAAAGEDLGDEEPQEEQYKPCRPRPPLKSFQVFDPECEVYNEPYLDRMMRYFCEEEMEGIGECTSRVEMPWHEIELAKTIIIRKGKHPCERRAKPCFDKDPNRKCGPEYRRKKALYGNTSSNPNINTKGIAGTPGDDCICHVCGSSSQPMIPSRKSDDASVTCLCKPRVPSEPSEVVISGLKGKKKQKKKPSASMPTIPKKTLSCGCLVSTETLPSCKQTKPGVQLGGKTSPQSRTERIAALLDSCKKEMEPIKDGINQLRARIRELNIPDLKAYQEPPQLLGGSPGTSGGLNFMPPMYYPPPMMCYPYHPIPPCMYPPPGPSNSANAQVTRLPPSMNIPSSSKKCKCMSKHHQRVPASYPSSSDNTTTDYEEERRRHKRKGHNHTKRSRSRLICSCRPQESKTVLCPSIQSCKKGKDRVPSEERPQSRSSLCLCLTGSSTSKGTTTTKKSCKHSRIPRLVSQTSSKKSGIICPAPSLATQKTAFISCTSHLSDKSEKSDKSYKSTNNSLCEDCSVMMVESCATQSARCSYPRNKSSILKPQSKPDLATAATSCKIRFNDKVKHTNTKCPGYNPKMAEACVEVKRGRPVEDSSTESVCTPCKSRNA